VLASLPWSPASCPCVCVRPISAEKRRLMLLWLVHAHGAQWMLVELEEAYSANP